MRAGLGVVVVGCVAVSLLARSPEEIRNLSGAQAAVARVVLVRVLAACTPGRTLIWLRLPERGESPPRGGSRELRTGRVLRDAVRGLIVRWGGGW